MIAAKPTIVSLCFIRIGSVYVRQLMFAFIVLQLFFSFLLPDATVQQEIEKKKKWNIPFSCSEL